MTCGQSDVTNTHDTEKSICKLYAKGRSEFIYSIGINEGGGGSVFLMLCRYLFSRTILAHYFNVYLSLVSYKYDSVIF